MSHDSLKFLFKRKFLFSIILHIIHGFLFEKSKLYYPYTFNQNILLIKTDLYKFYLSSCFVLLGMPYILNKLSPNKYYSSRQSIINRYRNRNSIDLQIGSYLLGLSMILTGFCPSYLPMYLAISPILFLYSIAASYTTFIFYHVFSRLFFNRNRMGPVINEINNSSSISNEKEGLYNVGRIIVLSVGIILLLVFESGEQSISPGHTVDELIDLIYNGDYIPPGLTGLFCGFINFFLIFICDEYQTFTSEWLINIFYYTSEFTLDKTFISGQICLEQILKVFSMAFGVRLSLWMSKRQEIPIIDWRYYLSVGSGSLTSALAMCLTTASFSDHIYLMNAYVGNISSEIASWALGAAWVLLYLARLLGL